MEGMEEWSPWEEALRIKGRRPHPLGFPSLQQVVRANKAICEAE